ncbi:MAG: hypothetical protein ACRC2T_05610 [Thermoguttaceae bacterium]
MSIVFMSFAVLVYSSSNNWKTVAEEAKKAADAEKAKVQQLTAKQTELQKNIEEMLAAKANEIAALTTTVMELRNKEVIDKNKIAELHKENGLAETTVQLAHNEIENIRAELITLRDKFNKTQEDWNALFTSYVKKTDEAANLQQQLTNLEDTSRDLVRILGDAQEVLRKFGLKADPNLYTGVPPHLVAGKVTEVRGANSGNNDGFVAITIGSDSGLMKGHQLDVFRKLDGRDEYLGVVEVVLTEPNEAVCKIIPEYRKGTIKSGDIVTSEFSQERQKYQKTRDTNVATANR